MERVTLCFTFRAPIESDRGSGQEGGSTIQAVNCGTCGTAPGLGLVRQSDRPYYIGDRQDVQQPFFWLLAVSCGWSGARASGSPSAGPPVAHPIGRRQLAALVWASDGRQGPEAQAVGETAVAAENPAWRCRKRGFSAGPRPPDWQPRNLPTVNSEEAFFCPSGPDRPVGCSAWEITCHAGRRAKAGEAAVGTNPSVSSLSSSCTRSRSASSSAAHFGNRRMPASYRMKRVLSVAGIRRVDSSRRIYTRRQSLTRWRQPLQHVQ
jgi:hypothetical protein